MSETTEAPISISRSLQTEAITDEQLARYVHDKKCLGPCAACGSVDWAFPRHEGKPELLMTPSARDPRVADWFFQMCCDNCGCARLLGANYVWAYCYPEEAAKE